MAPQPPFPPHGAPEPPAIRRLDEREEEGRLKEGGEAGWDAPLGYAPEDEDYASYKARMQRRLQRTGSVEGGAGGADEMSRRDAPRCAEIALSGSRRR